MTAVRTDALRPGDRVATFHGSGVVRTVARVVPSGWLNSGGLPIFYVLYAEEHTAEWGEGNSALAATLWAMAGAS